jgi:hypothetical protein
MRLFGYFWMVREFTNELVKLPPQVFIAKDAETQSSLERLQTADRVVIQALTVNACA